ncbi:response regulator [Chroococcidiopsis sp. FACHB-1243]|uniref:response regulator n=1 Tax=Chroococcidiopsis sp. [FACHB-1243] TaxID=2692781 RepID=UPI00177B2578|nr:response regulator [Chroococcidiopsis sp. [FACHB-1243]]MBD2306395.1 response regulator [Chroococcidiopsis sp. [FACHB-1243]]
MEILVIDYDEYSLLLIDDFLTLNNFQVLTANNARTGLQIAREQQPDLIICELNLPRLSGYEVLRILRSEPSTASIPFWFLSFEADMATRRRALQQGADGYFTKPINLNELLSAIRDRF